MLEFRGQRIHRLLEKIQHPSRVHCTGGHEDLMARVEYLRFKKTRLIQAIQRAKTSAQEPVSRVETPGLLDPPRLQVLWPALCTRILDLFSVFGLEAHGQRRSYPAGQRHRASILAYLDMLNLPIPIDGNYYKLPEDHLNACTQWLATLVYWTSNYSQVRLPFQIQLTGNPSVMIAAASNVSEGHFLRYQYQNPRQLDWLIALSMLHYDIGFLLSHLCGVTMKRPEELRCALRNLVSLRELLDAQSIKVSGLSESLPSFNSVLRDTALFYQQCTSDSRGTLAILEEDIDWSIIAPSKSG